VRASNQCSAPSGRKTFPPSCTFPLYCLRRLRDEEAVDQEWEEATGPLSIQPIPTTPYLALGFRIPATFRGSVLRASTCLVFYKPP